MKIPLVGQSFTSRSLAVAAQQTINLFPALIDDVANAAGAKNRGALYGTPNRHLFKDVGRNVRCLWGGGGRLFVVNGAVLSELTSGALQTDRSGAIADDGLPAQIYANGNQLLIISGGLAYCDNGAGPVACTFRAYAGTVQTFGTQVSISPGITTGDKFLADGTWTGTSITINGVAYTIASVEPNGMSLALTSTAGFQSGVAYTHAGAAVTAVGGAYLDGYFIVQRPRTPGAVPDLGRQINYSKLMDGTTWNGLDFQNKDAYPDYLRSILADNEQLYLFGDESLEVWETDINATATGNVFRPIKSAMSRFGSVSATGQVSLDGRVYFLGGDDRGQLSAYMIDGFTPRRISHHAAEAQWNAAGLGRGAISYAYQEEGHSFFVINFGSQTWAYDPEINAWHTRYAYTGGAFAPYRTQYHVYIPEWGTNGKHITAGLDTKVCESSVNFYDDLGADIKWLRTLPYLYNGGRRQFYGQLALEMETGSVPSGAAPVVTMDYSDNRGRTFINPRTSAIGTATETAVRVIWNRNGSSRGRIFRFAGVGQYKVALVDCECDLVQGAV